MITLKENSRTLLVPDDEKYFGVESDEKVESRQFEIPRMTANGLDLSSFALRINYFNAAKAPGQYIVKDADANENTIQFSWEFSRKVTAAAGKVLFIICAISLDESGEIVNEWNTEPAEGTVGKGLEVSDPDAGDEEDIPEALISEALESALILINQRAQEVIDSIPEDYASLAAAVDELKGDLNELKTGGSGESVPTFLHGLKYVAIGDSIVELQGTKANPKKFGDFNMLKDLQNRDISNVTVSGYVGAIEEKYGLVCDNQGRSGHTLIQDYANLIAINYSDVALVTISYGCNDARLGNPLGTVNSSDISTYAGALNGLIKKIYEDNPECRIIVLSAIQRLRVSDFGIADANANGNYLVDFVDMDRKVAEKRSCYFIDMYRGCGINQTNLPYYTVEGVHPVNFGYKRMSALVLDEMRKITSITFEPFGTMVSGGAESDTPETGGGSDTAPEEETKPTEVEVSSLLTKDGYVYDGWPNDVLGRGSYKGIEVGQFIYLEPDKTYTLETYRDVGGTDSRIACVSNDASASNGGNYLHGASNDLKGWEVSQVQSGVYKWKRTFSTADSELPKRGTTVCRYLSFGCLNGWTDKAKLSYV